MRIPLTLNGVDTEVEAEPWERLLDVLRRRGLSSLKEGCDKGVCGSCTVLLDGKPVSSCLVRAALAWGRSVVTLDQFSISDDYADIMGGFEQAGITFCGYCDAGRIFTAYDIICTYSRPTRAQVEAAVANMACCCVERDAYVSGIAYAVARRHRRLSGGRNERQP